MRSFLMSCLAIVVIAVGAVVVLNHVAEAGRDRVHVAHRRADLNVHSASAA